VYDEIVEFVFHISNNGGFNMKNKMSSIHFFTFSVLTVFLCFIQISNVNAELVFQKLQTKDGLSHDTVYSIAQDKNGYIWFGTEDGLNKYNGYTIEIYRSEKGGNKIGNANISTILVDDENQLWLASWGGGLQVLNQETGLVKIYKNIEGDTTSLSDNNVHSLFKDSKGRIWVGTYTQGLNQYLPESDTFESYKHDENNVSSLSNNRVWWINEDKNGNLLIGTNNGLDSFNPDTKEFKKIDTVTARVRTIYWDSNDNLWLGTQKGLCQLDLESSNVDCFINTEEDTAANVITSIYEDSFKKLWIGTSNGLNTFDVENKAFERYILNNSNVNSLSNNDIRAIFEDESSNLWIGTRGGGVNKINIKPSKFETYGTTPNELITLSDKNVFSLYVDKADNLWVGTNNGGLNFFDLKGNSTILMNDIEQESNRNLTDIVEMDDNLWVGSLGGLNQIDKLSLEVKTYKFDENDEKSISHNTILSLLNDSRGSLWVGTLGGLNLYQSQEDNFKRFYSNFDQKDTLSSDSIQVLFEDSSNRIWVGTNKGLNLMNSDNISFKRYLYSTETENGISDDIINTIFEDSQNRLWIGTQYGLNLYNSELDNFTVYTTENGLPNNTIKSIQEDDDGHLWISTNGGISEFNLSEMKFMNYDIYDGLQGNGYNLGASTKMRNGLIFFGGINGLDLVDNKKTNKITFSPKLTILNFSINGKEYDLPSLDNTIELDYSQKNLHVAIASMDYTNVSRNQFAYMLEGYDKDWNYIGSRNSFDYTNLPSGNFILRIKSTNFDGVWSEKELNLQLKISPPWWKTNLAYFMYILGFLLTIVVIVRIYINRQIRKNKALELMLNNTMNVISRIAEMKDTYTVGHQKRVRELSVAIAKEMSLNEEQIKNIELGSMIHDIGKISISSEYLNKPGKLLPLEYEIIQTHVENGCKIIEDINFPKEVYNIIAQHHERLDGTGYPKGLVKDQIGIESRIVSVADVVEAMCNNRPYRKAVGIDAALSEIENSKGTKYDAEVVETCINLFKYKKFKFSKN